MSSMEQREAIGKVRAFKSLLHRHFDVEKVYLFGSYARAEQQEESDIDVAVVVRRSSGHFFNEVPLLWKLRRKIDVRIEPLIIQKDSDPSGLLEEIEEYGIEVV